LQFSGIGSSIFHPGVAVFLGSGGKEVGFPSGGNTGLGPLLVAIIVAPGGQISSGLCGGKIVQIVFTKIIENHCAKKTINEEETVPFSKRKNKIAIGVLLLFIFEILLYVQYVELLYFYLINLDFPFRTRSFICFCFSLRWQELDRRSFGRSFWTKHYLDIHFRGSLLRCFAMLICFGLVFCQ
jgi:hypothetical protein